MSDVEAMKEDKVRPFFRVLAILASIPGWFSVLLSFAELSNGGFAAWVSFIGSLAFSGWLIFIGLTGKAPAILKDLLKL